MANYPDWKLSRRALLGTVGAATVAATVPAFAQVPPARAVSLDADWTPEPHPDAGQYFVIDGVAHAYNHADYNMRQSRSARVTLDTNSKWHLACTPKRYQLTAQQYNRDWQADELADLVFLESTTDMMVMHSVPIYDTHWDGLVSNEKGAYLKHRYGDRVLWYGALDVFRPMDALRAQADQLIAQDADGIKLYPTRLNPETDTSEGWLMSDEKRAFPVFEYLRDLGVRHVAIHKLVGYTGPQTAALGIDDMYRAAEAFPEITFHLVHAGWQNFDETVRLMRERENITAVMEGPFLFPLYDMELFDRMMAAFMKNVDINRIIYASTAANQHPYWMLNAFYDYQPPAGADFEITQSDKAKILGGNLARYHGIDIPAQRLKIADDKFSRYKAENGLREPYIVQRST
jgi:predicted TIM-barrel fold metal-dependent hydrolase